MLGCCFNACMSRRAHAEVKLGLVRYTVRLSNLARYHSDIKVPSGSFNVQVGN